MKKRLLSMAITACMLVGVLPNVAHATNATSARSEAGEMSVATYGANGSGNIGVDTEKAILDIKNAGEAAEVQVIIPVGALIPADILEAARGRNVNVSFDYGRYAWVINGSSVTGQISGDIDLRTNDISSLEITEIYKNSVVLMFEIAHDGKLPFDAVLEYPVDKKYSDKKLYLYHYNEAEKELEYRDFGNVIDGKIGLLFDHASQYVLTSKPIHPFADIKSDDWFYNSVQATYTYGLFRGTAETMFSPQADMTRAMLWTVLARQAGHNTKGSEPWYEAGRMWCMQNKVSDGTNPDDSLTREQLVATLYSYAQSIGRGLSGDYMINMSQYTDLKEVADWANEAFVWAKINGIVEGVTETELSPKTTATRAQVAAVMQRFMEQA